MKNLMVALPLLAAFLCSSPASAQSAILQDGIAQFEQVDLEGAIATFNAALRSSSSGRTDAARAHAYLATLHAMLGEEANDAAEVHARIAIALDHRVLPPSSAPTEVRRMFTELRQTQGEARIVFEVQRDGPEGQRTVFVRTDPAPDGMLAEVEVRCAEADLESVGDAAGFTFVLPSDGDIECVARGLSVGGAVWFERRETIFEDAPVEGRRWKLAVGVVAGVVALVGAGVAIGVTQRADGDEPDGTIPPPVVAPLLSWGGLR